MNPYIYKCTIIKVIDGDTVDAVIDMGFRILTTQRIRLYGIDTPELNDKDEAKRDLAKKVKEYVESLLLTGEDFTIKTYKSDSFGRWLGIIYLPNGEDLNQKLINEGLATIWQ